MAGFCWDFEIDGPSGKYPKGSDGAPFYAAAPGTVITVRQSASSGTSEYSNYIDLEQARSEIATYVHLQKNSAAAKLGSRVTQDEKLALTGDTGTDVGGFHLHFAVNDKPDQTKGFVTIPIAFSDYEVRLKDGAWRHVPRGVPTRDQVVRNPPTPRFGPKSLSPTSVVARASDRMNLIATDKNGRTWMSRWEPDRYARNWDRWRPVLKPVGGALAVEFVSRAKPLLDVVTSDEHGRVYTGALDESVEHSVWRGWWRIKDLVSKPDSPVAVTARSSGKLDVFAVRNDGVICTAAWDRDVADGKWRGWWPVASGITHPGTPIAARARASGKLDLFAVGLDGGVYTAAWDHDEANGAWQGWWPIA